MKRNLLSLFITSIFTLLFTINLSNCLAQTPTQTIRGIVYDAESNFPLTGATVLLMKDSSIVKGIYSDENGKYRFDEIAVGRYSLHITYVGYIEGFVRDIILSSGKESVIDVHLESSAKNIEEIVVSANKVGQSSNEMSTVSTRTFSIEETNRYAGSRGDPARMASNFAGVQGADDSRNDIVVRGNSPSGVLWRLEGVDIFNPNHFNIPGTAGGPVSILNNKILANSDFYTGAFPAELGNSIAGAFDLKLRNGNNEKHEFSGQFGFLGTEVLAEGPFSKKSKSTYLVTYRYSTLALFSALGIEIGTDAVPHYQDGSFRLNFPMKGNTNFSVFGVGGMSKVAILISEQTKPIRNIYGENDRDQYFASQMGVVGFSLNKSFNQNLFSKFTLMYQDESQKVHHELVYRHINADSVFVVDSIPHLLGYSFMQDKVSAAWYLTNRINNHLSFKTGFNIDTYFFNFLDSVRSIDTLSPLYYQFYKRWDAHEMANLIQPYFQIHYKPSDALTFNIGLHALYFSLGNALSPVEPRIGMKYEMKNNQSLNIGLGMHSQIQNTYLYFYSPDFSNGVAHEYNHDMGLTKSYHAVISYDKLFGKHLYFKTEAYYQYLYDVPVTKQSSSFSLVNSGAGFSRFFPDTLENKGTGQNYGLEFTLEKGFSKNYYFLLTLSMFESNYKGSDGVERRTDFNGQYAANGILAKEFVFKNKHALQLSTKITVAGGRWYGPVDTAASVYQKDIVYIDSARNTLQLPSYFRADLKINYRINGKKVSHEIGLDIVNLFDTKNILKLTYAPDNFDATASPIRYDYQLGRLPLFYYRIDF